MNSIVSEKKFIQERLGIPYQNLSQSYLRAETELTALSTYNFYLQAGQVAAPIVTERLLNLNDQFVITHFTIGLKYNASTATPSSAQHLAMPVYTYVDPNVMTGNGLNAEALYNSNLSFIIDRKQYLPEFPIRSFKRVPTTQSAVNSGYATGPITANGYDNGLYGFFPSEPTLIDGRQTLDLAINLNAATTINTASKYISAVFELRGYLVVNAKS
jgi:hypothetical protein